MEQTLPLPEMIFDGRIGVSPSSSGPGLYWRPWDYAANTWTILLIPTLRFSNVLATLGAAGPLSAIEVCFPEQPARRRPAKPFRPGPNSYRIRTSSSLLLCNHFVVLVSLVTDHGISLRRLRAVRHLL